MADRRLTAVIVVVAVWLAASILHDTLSSVTQHVRHRNTAATAAPGTAANAPAALGAEPAKAGSIPEAPTASESAASAPGPAPELSYADQLARAETRRRVRASAGYTYLDEIVAESADSALHRWDGRLVTPVRVYVTQGSVPNFQAAFVDAVRGAFQRWQDAGVPVRFDLDADSDDAEVEVRWTERFDIERTGQTDLVWDGEGRIQRGVITIATLDPQGRPLGPDDVRVVALHEVGHLLGLDHSSDSTDIMFAKTQARDLSERDIRTAALLYELAPGSMR
jgi:hypothetical protein